jgi:hypothetical protein
MRFGPDGLLYVSIGAPCDVCLGEGGLRRREVPRREGRRGAENWLAPQTGEEAAKGTGQTPALSRASGTGGSASMANRRAAQRWGAAGAAAA